MTAEVDIVNLALQTLGSRTTVGSSEYTNQTSNEAIQAKLVIDQLRRTLLRMAPWGCAKNYAQLTYISSLPGTPENATVGTSTWVKGQPPPPWVYEYQYPKDCLRACWIVPQFATGFASGVPITTAVTGAMPTYFNGPPVRFQVAVDQFYAATAAAVVAGGTGYAVGDQITLAGTPASTAPIGAPAVLQVATLAASAVATVTPVSNVLGETLSGSYFAKPTNPIAQGSTTGVGSGATFNLTLSSQGDQRVLLTNQQSAVLAYVKEVTDYNVLDESFVEAFTNLLGSTLILALTGDKALANLKLAETNAKIIQARQDDGNESLTVNDITPDWIRTRGIWTPDGYGGGFGWGSYDWGSALFPLYG